MGRRPNKYGAKHRECAAGHSHPSIREARRCDELHLMQRGGEIESLEREPFYPFVVNGIGLKHGNGRRVGYTPDFRFIDRQTGRTVVEEAKGYAARDWPLRKALFIALHPDIIFREV